MDEFNTADAAVSIASDLGLSTPAEGASNAPAASPPPAGAPSPAPAPEPASAPAAATPAPPAGTTSPAPAGTAGTAAAPAPGADPAAAAPVAPPAAPGPDDAPKTWSATGKAAWANASPELKAEVLKREEDFFRGIEQYKGAASVGNALQQALAPYLPVMNQYGINPMQQISGLMQAHFTLATGSKEQKAALYAKIGRDYGIEAAAPTPEGYVDPEVLSLRAEIEALKSNQSQDHARRVQQVRQTIESEVEAFSKDPANIYFEDVIADVTRLMQSGVVSTLKEAYDKAIWTNPTVREKEIARIQADAEKRRETERKEAEAKAAAKAEAARKATAANVRTTAKSGSATAPLGSIDDTLNEAYAKLTSQG